MHAGHEGRFVVPAFDFRACTHARMHTRLFLHDGVKHAQHVYPHTPALTPRLRGQECAIALLPRACIPLPPATVPLGHHPRLVRTARNSATLQKWYNCVTYLPLIRRCIVGFSWRRHAGTRRQLSTQELRTQECSQGSSWVSGLLVGVRWRMGAWSRGGSVRARVHASTHPIFSVLHVQHRSHSTKQLLQSSDGHPKNFLQNCIQYVVVLQKGGLGGEWAAKQQSASLFHSAILLGQCIVWLQVSKRMRGGTFLLLVL